MGLGKAILAAKKTMVKKPSVAKKTGAGLGGAMSRATKPAGVRGASRKPAGGIARKAARLRGRR